MNNFTNKNMGDHCKTVEHLHNIDFSPYFSLSASPKQPNNPFLERDIDEKKLNSILNGSPKGCFGPNTLPNDLLKRMLTSSVCTYIYIYVYIYIYISS